MVGGCGGGGVGGCGGVGVGGCGSWLDTNNSLQTPIPFLLLTPIELTGNTFALFHPQIAESYGVLTSNKDGKVLCENDGWVLRGMQIGVLVRVLFWCAGDGAGAVLQALFWVAACGAI